MITREQAIEWLKECGLIVSPVSETVGHKNTFRMLSVNDMISLLQLAYDAGVRAGDDPERLIALTEDRE